MSKKSNQDEKKYIKWIWLTVTGPFVFLIFIILLIQLGVFGKLPTIEELENPQSKLASEIISADQVTLGKYYVENRINVRYDELPKNLVDALISTEDARFYSHAGIDLKALFRVLVRTVLGGDSDSGGGSTITQQLAKNMFPREDLNKFQVFFRKIKEWIIAIKLERNFTKEEIIALYFTTVDFGNQAFGIKTASKIFFNKEPKDLKTEEAALLVGVLKGPSFYNPRRNYERAITRRNVVLNQMLRYEKISRPTYDSIKQLPIDLKNFKAENSNTGVATYFREFMREQLTEWCNKNVKPDGTHYNLYRDGLKIYTTINYSMQSYAEEAVKEHLSQLQKEFFNHWKGHKLAPFSGLSEQKVAQIIRQGMLRSERYKNLKDQGLSEAEIEKEFNKKIKLKVFSWKGDTTVFMSPMDSIKYHKFFLQAGFMSVEPQTGYIRAWVGGINHKYFKYDHVYKSKRQVGSTFKPFVYATAMQEGWSPCMQVPNTPICIENNGKKWCPSNSSEGYEGAMVPLKTALALSINRVSAYIIKQFGVTPVIQMARRLGITSPIEPVPSICLGTPDISVYEMVGAISAFVNKGLYIQPSWLIRIEDKYGNVLFENTPKSEDAVNEQTAYLTVELMKGVVEGGTATRLRGKYGLKNPIAGKTGTTQNNSDGWFLGLTPELVSGVWVGCEDRAAHFRSTALGQGANMALPIWGLYMRKVYSDKKLNISRGDFERPDILETETNCEDFQQEDIFLPTDKEKINENFDQ